MDEGKRWVLKPPPFSPMGLLLRAAIIAALFVIAHLVGLREYTSVLSGTSPSGQKADVVSAVLGSAYIFLYFAFVLLVPVLMLGAGIFACIAIRSNKTARG